MDTVTDLVAIIMIFAIPLTAIITSHKRKTIKMKQKLVQDELELEKLKNENYMLETEKLRLELEKMKVLDTKDDKNKIL